MSASALRPSRPLTFTGKCAAAVVVLLLSTGAASAQGRSISNARLSHRGLTPAPDSEVTLSEVAFTTDETGHLKAYLRGEMKKKELTRIFWLIDPRTSTYSALRLSGNDVADAKRVARLLQNRGQAMSEAVIGARLTSERIAAEAKQLRMEKAKEAGKRDDEFSVSLPCPAPPPNADPMPQHGPFVDEGVQWSQTCTGWGWASIQTWELAIQYGFTDEFLNETYLETDWLHERYWWGAPDYWEWDSSGSCWANNATFFNTHWYTVLCQPIATNINGPNFDQQKTGSYLNVDFSLAVCAAFNFCPWPYPVAAQTTTTAAVQYANGRANWGTSFNIDTDYELYTWLLQHIFLVGTASGGADEPASWCDLFCDPDPDDVWECTHREDNYFWDYDICDCVAGASPIVIDLERDGFSFTSANDGVQFDILSRGAPVQVAWTKAGSRDAFLSLDRNHNGFVDDSSELFGNFTLGAGGDKKRGPNGFAALSEFDLRANGGNGDGQISAEDRIFTSLRLWTDSNHDGISQPSELTTLQEAGIVAISLHYAAASHRDEFGNIMRFQTIVTMKRDALEYGLPKRGAVDVFFVFSEKVR